MQDSDNLPNDSDIVIIGGGIMGTSIAFFLSSETELDITLVEKDSIATGSTGDSSAILRHHYGDQEIYSKMAWWSHRFYRRFDEKTGEAIAYEENPLVRFANEDTPGGTYAQDGYEVLSDLDIPVTRYGSEELPDQYPMLTGVEDYDFGISDDEAGYSDGADAANGFDRAARRNGATVITGTGVESITVDDGAVVGVETEDGEITCETVVVAAGPWTPRLGETVDVDIPISVTREQIIGTSRKSLRELC
ncbi:NAD(P)/FAD-dependent oxidoreductase [Natribaculum luteum]|uniref:NAD(P)/FAD-dependent oxidoreductase n=1 Tax=Natribaculum luteum TaxID=1586232 RepID=A0ABD5NZM0_9EURY|nr:FAD-dependent oxidoreductase [Natribaculum luteum]